MQTRNVQQQPICFPLLETNPAVPQIVCVQFIQSMLSNSKHKAECKTAAGQTSKREGSGEAWKQFWVVAESKTKKRRKKPLTREESKRRKQVEHARKDRKKVVDVLNDKKTLLKSGTRSFSCRTADNIQLV